MELCDQFLRDHVNIIEELMETCRTINDHETVYHEGFLKMYNRINPKFQ